MANGNYNNGKYKQISKLGHGSQGDVYLCEDISSKKKVAIKFIMSSKMEFIQTELDLMIKLKNPYVIEYIDHFNENLVFGIVMVYCEKGDLGKAIKNKKETETKFDNEQVFQWLFEMIEGLCYLHKHRIIHRDIKPSNIFLTNDDRIVLGDLGVCKAFSTDSTSIGSSNVGSFPYKSPEMINSCQSYSFNTDIWSLGCTIYELITLNIYSEKYYLKVNQIQSEELQQLLNKMLQKDPSKRIGSFELRKIIIQMKTIRDEKLKTLMLFKRYSSGNINFLTSINLSHIQLTQIDKDTFSDLVNLNSINLSHNQLTQMDKRIFSGLFDLNKIYLSYNKLTQLDKDTFCGLENLKGIYLSGNQITRLDRNIFDGLVNLREIALSGNRLTHIDKEIFSGLANLNSIYLYNNQLKHIDDIAFRGLESLKEIGLSGNHLTQIDKEIFRGLVNLNSIYLCGNKLKQIDKDTFSGLSNLITIDLSHNQLTQIEKNTFRNLLNLNTIDLGRNRLTRIDKDTFRGLESLKEIGLSGNHLTQIDKEIFCGLINLNSIYLDNNKFTSQLELILESSVTFVALKDLFTNELVVIGRE